VVSERLGVIDTGVAIGWLQGEHRSLPKIQALFSDARAGRVRLTMSAVNLAEFIKHTAEVAKKVGLDPVAALMATGVSIHEPGEAIARRVARLQTSLGDGFAAATAQELGCRLHTTDAELIGHLRGAGISVTKY
jgi:predicted nucleic acid-binding protein